MKFRTRVLGVAALATLSGVAVAREEVRYVRHGDRFVTATSGVKSDHAKETVLAGTAHALTGLRLWEVGDRPCSFQLQKRTLHPTLSGAEWEEKVWVCGGAGRSEKTLTLGAGEYIQGVRLCTNEPSDPEKARLKGVHLYGVRLQEDGTLAEGASKKFERPNCKRWRSKVSCAAGQVAYGMRFFIGEGGIFGAELWCQPVKKTTVIVR